MKYFVYGVVIAGTMLILPLLGVIVGAVAGIVVGFFFPSVVQLTASFLFGMPVASWQTGAVLGFIASFFARAPKKD